MPSLQFDARLGSCTTQFVGGAVSNAHRVNQFARPACMVCRLLRERLEAQDRSRLGVWRGNSGLFRRREKLMNEVTRDFSVHVWRWWSGVLHTGVMLVLSLLAVPDARALDATPTMLGFQAVQGSTNPPSQIVNILKNNDRTLSWSSSDNATWVSVSPTTGSLTNSAQISVSVNPAGLGQCVRFNVAAAPFVPFRCTGFEVSPNACLPTPIDHA